MTIKAREGDSRMNDLCDALCAFAVALVATLAWGMVLWLLSP